MIDLYTILQYKICFQPLNNPLIPIPNLRFKINSSNYSFTIEISDIFLSIFFSIYLFKLVTISIIFININDLQTNNKNLLKVS